ncbi:Piso0_001277 [Millerozyma farinosa CBS 7064]|uniref:Piso0_001277 protein n=1 Tax=Pichia sorbitophila (strain ATCC MYA-4447 / BCRC 22081 / CBS 7064 / NBRC 10061 / NRRL Y-12695) TaxID=559304 RepID=G8YDX8_PICSO|nr:Piso0_001277 [Millerozyma farinosa CBS 7064]
MSQTFPVASDLSATWSFIQPGLEYILGAEGDQGVTPKMYMNCYTAVYNYCVNKSRHGSSNAPINATTGNNSYSLAGAEIYSKLDEYLVKFVNNLKKDPDELFLEFYVKRWTRFTIGAGYMNNVFDYMNRYWVQKERSDGRRDVFDVNTLALLKWKAHMFNNNADQLIDEVLEQIERQRNNEIVDTYYISTAIKSLVYLGIDIQDLKKPNLVVYIKHFEHKFLEKTAEYYGRESARFLSQHNVVDYMKKCETRLSEEVSRSNNYLEDHTKKPLLETLNDVLIKDHAQAMYDQFLSLLEHNEIEHIQIMYKLLSRVPFTLQPLADSLEKYINDEAAKALEEIKSAAETQEETTKVDSKPQRRSNSGIVSPKTYIHTLISIYVKFNDIVAVAFSNDPIFIKSLDNACRRFVNKNSIAMSSPKSSCKTPELLARYADGFLKATSKEADIIGMTTENLMIIFKFIEDKDAFEEHYRRLLAKRLINGNTKSDELEESIIQKLQEENSLEYTSKMTKMFQDMKSSEDLKNTVREHLKQTDNTVKDFSPLILAQSMWPFKHSDDYQLNLAPELLPAFDKVQEIYNKKHTGRQLQWLWNHGKSEIKANLSKKGKPPFLFTVSNVQLMILLAFNKSSTYSFEELLNIVGVAKHTFESHLLPFTKYKLLEQEPAGQEYFSNNTTKFTIVDEYKSKKLKVNFVSSIKTEQKQEEEDANKEIDESRKNFLSACIVRIMKARKEMKHNELVNEVATQSLSRFRAKIIDIKRVIDYLIEKEYIRRIGNDSYEYLA